MRDLSQVEVGEIIQVLSHNSIPHDVKVLNKDTSTISCCVVAPRRGDHCLNFDVHNGTSIEGWRIL